MKNFFYLSFCVAAFSIMSGCSSLATMKTTEKVGAVGETKALVNIVRPRIFLGDGVNFEVWDGSQFIGTLKAGSMIQYVTLPGEHDFMIDPTQGGKWAYKNMKLEAGKTYYLKPNTAPFVGLILGVAESTDERIVQWNKELTPLAIDKNKSKAVPQKNIEEAESNLNSFKVK